MSTLQHRGRFASWTTIDAANDATEGLVRLADLVNLEAPDELRSSKGDFEQLCTSIKERGLISEIQVRRVKGGYRIVAGRHRAAAHKALGYKTVPAAIVDLDDEAEALQMLEENLLRTDLDPWHEALAFQEAMERGGLKQGELAKRIGKSQPTISKRLAMLKAPACIGQLAPEHIRIEDVPVFAPLTAHPEFAKRVAKAMVDGHSSSAEYVLREACRAKPTAACMPFTRFSGMIDNHPGLDWSNRHRVVQNKKYRADVEELDHVVIKHGAQWSVVCFDVRGVKDAIERTKQRLQDADATNNKASSTRFEKSPEEKRATRIQNKERSLQLECMVDHLSKQDAFGEDLVKHAYRRFLKSVGQVASRKVEQLALAAILGEYAPPERKNSWGSTEKPLARGCPELVDELWDTDRVVLDRYVAAVVHLHAGGYDHQVLDDAVLKFTAGKTTKQIHAAAVAAVDGPKKPTKPKKKAPAKKADIPKGSKAAKQIHELHTTGAAPKAKPDGMTKEERDAYDEAAKKAAREHEIQRQKDYPHYCIWAPCRRRFKTKDELDEHDASCKHAARGKNGASRPGAATGRPTCPICHKGIKPVNGKIPRHKDPKTGDWCILSGDALAEAIAELTAPAEPGAAAGKECPKCLVIVSKKGRGDDARLECGCTPLDGVPVEVAA